MTDKWEYKLDQINVVVKGAIEAKLKERGEAGFELVSSYREGPFLYAIFKRRVQS